jgi:ADP-ribose pyrophosphatase YjhB (NUDIX family)
MDPKWLEWAKQLQAIAQNGLAFAADEYDRQRYVAVRGIAAAMIAAGCDAAPSRIEEIFAAQKGYATPKVDVRAAVFREERILLVQERSDGCWTLPGGWADPGEGPRLSVEREVREESGFEVRAAKLAAVYDRNRHVQSPFIFDVWKLFFVCELVGGTARTSLETEAVEFFALEELPPLSTGRSTATQIAHMFEHHRAPALPATFD